MSDTNKEFEEIVQSIKSDEEFIRQTGKISKRPVGARALALGIIMTVVGVCGVPLSIALLTGFWSLVTGALAFSLSVWGGMLVHGAWGTVGMNRGTSGNQSKLMQKANAIWDKHLEEGTGR